MLWTSVKRKKDNKWELVLVDGLEIVCKSGMISRSQKVMFQMENFMNQGINGELSVDISEELKYLRLKGEK